MDQAKSILSDYHHSQNHEEKEIMSIQVLRAMQTVLTATSSTTTTTTISTTTNAALEKALTSTELMYTPPPPAASTLTLTEEQKRHRRRMERLRLRSEETFYHKLTANIEHKVADDVTTRSMTYAASVGLNMIVAPLSFGCFCYFFAGQVFHWVAPQHELRRMNSPHLNPNTPDVRRVIAGVVGGVAMLFIEMILFVIRTHEFDKSIRQKDKRKSTNPFGQVGAVGTATAAATLQELEEIEMTPLQRQQERKTK
jgi:hypothetical protein